LSYILNKGHASVHAITKFFPSRSYSGFALEREITFLYDSVVTPQRPLAAVIGGIKVSSKISLLRKLLEEIDILLIGGAMAFTFYKALGHDVGDSFLENDAVELALDILNRASETDTIIKLASDCVVVKTTDYQEYHRNKKLESHQQLELQTVMYDQIPSGYMALDIGPRSIEEFHAELSHCKTIVWNGPMGKCEELCFSAGTLAIMEMLTACTRKSAITIACGGDTVAAIDRFEPDHSFSFTHISMGGGAALALLSGEKLPGIEALQTSI
jgi:phosphoglycerate kinase